MDVRAFGLGQASSVVLAGAFIAGMKAQVALLDHGTLMLPLLVAPSNLRMHAALERKW